jgi:hypothetical protein
MVAEALVTSFFCRFEVPQELQSDQGCNCEFRLIQEVLQCLGVSKTCTTPPAPTVGGRGLSSISKRLRSTTFVVSHQRGWDVKLPVFLPAYRAYTHDTARLTPSNPVFRKELCQPCDLLSGAPPTRVYPPSTTWQTL